MKYPVTTICGSMRFFDEMVKAANQLTLEGRIVLMPFVAYIKPEDQEDNPVKEMLDKMHFRKIEMSDSICVVSANHRFISGQEYIGESTQSEIDHALDLDRDVLYW